jgi:surfactin synthase thioesterase subunit
VGEEEEAALHGQVLFFDGGHFFIPQRFKRDFNSKNSRDFALAVAEFGI